MLQTWQWKAWYIMKAQIIKYGSLCVKCECKAKCIDVGEIVTIVKKRFYRSFIKRDGCVALADNETLKLV